MEIRPAILLFLLLLSAAGTPLHAACLNRQLARLERIAHDSTVELEMVLDPKAMELLTTLDGTIGPVLIQKNLPDWLLQEARKQRVPVRAVKWDPLTFQQKMEILEQPEKNQAFRRNRKIEGLTLKHEVLLHFDEPTLFLGKTYPPGSHRFKARELLGDYVEFASPQDLKDLRGIELHLRAGKASNEFKGLTASEISKDARTLLKALGLPESHQHAHIVGELVRPTLSENIAMQALLKVEFARRMDILAEMFAILKESRPIQVVKNDGVIAFDPLTSEEMSILYNYLHDLGTDSQSRIPKPINLKGYIGIKGMGYYDDPHLWGIEYRAISKDSDPRATGEILDAIQWSMNRNEFGVSPITLEKWAQQPTVPGAKSTWTQLKDFGLAYVGLKLPENQLDRLHWNRNWSDLIADLRGSPNPELRKQVVTAKKLEKLLIADEHLEFKMLAHDWSQDPLIFQDTVLQQRIQAAQIKALKEISHFTNVTTPKEATDLMKEFLTDSGLYERFKDSLPKKP